jgi:hypothetical protein
MAVEDGSTLAHTAGGAERIAAERKRQVEAEGWTPEHDLQHDSGELASAAAAYTYAAIVTMQGGCWRHEDPVPGSWPWSQGWWKPSDDPIRNLEKAGALIAAEIDRLTRS